MAGIRSAVRDGLGEHSPPAQPDGSGHMFRGIGRAILRFLSRTRPSALEDGLLLLSGTPEEMRARWGSLEQAGKTYREHAEEILGQIAPGRRPEAWWVLEGPEDLWARTHEGPDGDVPPAPLLAHPEGDPDSETQRLLFLVRMGILKRDEAEEVLHEARSRLDPVDTRFAPGPAGALGWSRVIEAIRRAYPGGDGDVEGARWVWDFPPREALRNGHRRARAPRRTPAKRDQPGRSRAKRSPPANGKTRSRNRSLPNTRNRRTAKRSGTAGSKTDPPRGARASRSTA